MGTVGENIKHRRLSLNMTQEELAEKVGYKGKSMISHIENNIINVPAERITAFAQALGTSEHYIMTGEEISIGMKSIDIIEQRLKDLDLRALFAVRDYINYLIVKNGGDPNDN